MTHTISTSLIPLSFTMFIVLPALIYAIARIRRPGSGGAPARPRYGSGRTRK
jgi:hypothetical protein